MATLRELVGSSATQEVYERLRADVLAFRFRPGQRLKINDLCAMLSVSPGAVREALSRMTAEGLVVAEPQRGFRVAPISNADLRDLTEVRADIESMCLRRAIRAGGTAWENKVRAACETLSALPEREPGDPQRLSDRWADAHGAYHAALVSACDSAWLLKIRAMLYSQSERYRRLSVPMAQSLRDLDREHRAIMQAATARDEACAVALLVAHLKATTRILLEANLVADEI